MSVWIFSAVNVFVSCAPMIVSRQEAVIQYTLDARRIAVVQGFEIENDLTKARGKNCRAVRCFCRSFVTSG